MSDAHLNQPADTAHPLLASATLTRPSRRSALVGLLTTATGFAGATGLVEDAWAADRAARPGRRGGGRRKPGKPKLGKKKVGKKGAGTGTKSSQPSSKATTAAKPGSKPSATPSAPASAKPAAKASAAAKPAAATPSASAAPKPAKTPTPPPPPPVLAPVPDAATRHLLSRFSYGVTPALLADAAAAGGAGGWFESQLNPAGIGDAEGDVLLSWFPSLSVDPLTQYARDRAGVQRGWLTMADYQRWTLLRRISSRRQLHEAMTEFWGNLIYIPAVDTSAFGYRFDFDATIRRHALGRFEDLLKATITHPAMLIQLDGGVSTKKSLNENLGRELLELHTLGVGNYTETDVLNSARILTGWKVDAWATWAATYEPNNHWVGPVTVGAFSHPNDTADGRAVTDAYLSYLARRPETANRIATRLARHFVSDTPSAGLIAQLAAAYLAADTAIAPMLRVLVASPEFGAAVGAKVLTPYNDVVKSFRVLGARINYDPSSDAAMNSILWVASAAGAMPMSWPRPDGEPIDNASHSSVGRVLKTFDMHTGLSGGWWPRLGVTYRTPVEWLPAEAVQFDYLVIHLCRQLWATDPPAGLIETLAEVVGLTPTTVLTANHSLVKWGFFRLLVLLLNSPQHMKR